MSKLQKQGFQKKALPSPSTASTDGSSFSDPAALRKAHSKPGGGGGRITLVGNGGLPSQIGSTGLFAVRDENVRES